MTTDAYRNAFEAALTDLTEITAAFEKLRARKNQVENLVVALQSVFVSNDSRVESVPPAIEPEQVGIPQQSTAPVGEATPHKEIPSSYSFMEVPSSLAETDGDPFQRRVRSSFRFRGLAAQRSY